MHTLHTPQRHRETVTTTIHQTAAAHYLHHREVLVQCLEQSWGKHLLRILYLELVVSEPLLDGILPDVRTSWCYYHRVAPNSYLLPHVQQLLGVLGAEVHLHQLTALISHPHPFPLLHEERSCLQPVKYLAYFSALDSPRQSKNPNRLLITLILSFLIRLAVVWLFVALGWILPENRKCFVSLPVRLRWRVPPLRLTLPGETRNFPPLRRRTIFLPHSSSGFLNHGQAFLKNGSRLGIQFLIMLSFNVAALFHKHKGVFIILEAYSKG